MTHPVHCVAIFGGAVAGAEASHQLANRGIYSIVFDQATLPYGKIEDGLPKWHSKLRDKEEQKINDKMNSPFVTYVPKTRLGADVQFEEVAKEWGFSAVMLATGAWNDRPLPIEGIDDYIDKGLYYQNPFVNWFNHYHEPGFSGKVFEVIDDAIIVGGGLASLDVAKILMINSVQEKLEEKGIEANMFTLDRDISRVLDEHDLSLDALGLKGCTLYYRRRRIDMPLSPMPTDTPELLEKAENVREKLLSNFQKKYLFRVKELYMPIDKIVEDDRLTGLVFQETKIEDGKAVPIEGSEVKINSELVISSIGSIPELIDGIPASRQTFNITDATSCQIEGYENVFAIGNAVTGRGNINESAKHGKLIAGTMMDNYLGWSEEDYEEMNKMTEENVANQVASIADKFNDKNLLSVEQLESITQRAKELQTKAGYDGDYDAWVVKHLPKRLEDMLEVTH